eukprot:237945_1
MGNSSSKHTWQQLYDTPPFGNKHCGRCPVVIDNEIILSPELTNKLYTFNTKSTSWNHHNLIHNNIWFQSLCVSNDGKCVYLYDGHNANVLLIIDSNTKKVIKTIDKIRKTGVWPSILIDPNNDTILHVIGGSSNNCHLTINTETEKMNVEHVFNEANGISAGAIVYIPQKEVAFLFHGDIPVYAYKFKSKKWMNTKIQFPMNHCKSFGYIKSPDNKYILIIGGSYRDDDNWRFNENIFIFDVNKMVFITSELKCPKCHNVNAVVSSSGDIHLFSKQNHWVKHIGEILPEYALYDNDEKESVTTTDGKTQKREDEKDDWECSVCTFINKSQHELCTVCYTGTRSDIDSKAPQIKSTPKGDLEPNAPQLKRTATYYNNVEMVKTWLTDVVNLPQYIDLFINEGYDNFVAIETMTDFDLMDIGVGRKGHRKTLMVFINKHKNRNMSNISVVNNYDENNQNNGFGVVEGGIIDTNNDPNEGVEQDTIQL